MFSYKTKKTKIAFWGLLAVIFTLLGSYVEAVTLSASVDRNAITLEDQVVYTLILEGSQNAQPPTLPPMKDFQVQQAGTSSQMSIINGSISRSVKFNYILIPQKNGKLVIGPSTLKHDGQTIKSRSIELMVQKPEADQSATSGRQGAEDQPRPIFARVSVSNEKPYENEQIVYTFRLYRSLEIVDAKLDLPQFSGFWAEELGKQTEFRENINGVNYLVTEIKKALFPLKPGKLTIDPAVLHCDVLVRDKRSRRRDPFGNFFNDPFFGQIMGHQKRVRKNIHSNELEIHVNPLPSKGKPKDFAKLVGKFSILASMEKEELEVGDTNTITVILEGDGNIRDMVLELPEDAENFKVYSDKPEVAVDNQGAKVIGRKTFKKALVPLKEGTYTLPKMGLSYFDPEIGQYQYLKAVLAPMLVTKSKEKETLEIVGDVKTVPEKNKVNVIGKDIFPIEMDGSTLNTGLRDGDFFRLVALIFALPTIIFIASFVYIRRKESKYSKADIYRSRSAFSVAGKKFKALASQGQVTNGRELFSESSRIFKDFIGDKLNVSGGTLTPADVEELLGGEGVPKNTRDLAVRLLEKCEAAQFAPLNASNNNPQAVINDIQLSMKNLDKEIKR